MRSSNVLDSWTSSLLVTDSQVFDIDIHTVRPQNEPAENSTLQRITCRCRGALDIEHLMKIRMVRFNSTCYVAREGVQLVIQLEIKGRDNMANFNPEPACCFFSFSQILPHLDRHLAAEASAGGDMESTEKARRTKSRKASASTAAITRRGDSGEELRRKDLRRRVVRFLGRLGGR